MESVLNSVANKRKIMAPNATMFGGSMSISDGKLPYYAFVIVGDQNKSRNVPEEAECDKLIAEAAVTSAEAKPKSGTDAKEVGKSTKDKTEEGQKKTGSVNMDLLVCMVNKERENSKVPLLGVDQKLVNAAQELANDLANSKGSKEIKDEKDSKLGERVKKAGYEWKTVKAITGSGYENEISVISAWIKSNNNRDNIVNQEVTAMGVAKSGTKGDGGLFYVAVFAADGSSNPTPPDQKKCNEVIAKAAVNKIEKGPYPEGPPPKKGYRYKWSEGESKDMFVMDGVIPSAVMDKVLKDVGSEDTSDKKSGEGQVE